MRAHFQRLALFSACCFAIAARPLGDEPHFTPKAGTSLRRSLETKNADQLKRFTMKIGEESHSSEDVDERKEELANVVVRDEFVSVTGTRVKKLERTYEKLSKALTTAAKTEKGEDSKHEAETSDLEGVTVVFAWDAAKKEYTRSFKAEKSDKPREHDKALLEPLVLDMDYTEFLPDHAIDEGQTWELDVADVRGALFRPGGDLEFHGEKPTPQIEKDLRAKMWDSLAGKLTAKHGGKREEDGRTLLVIAFEGKVEAGGEVDVDKKESGPDHYKVKGESQLEGEILWDIAAGRARSYTCHEEGGYTFIEHGKAKTKNGDDLEIEQTFEYESKTDYAMKFVED